MKLTKPQRDAVEAAWRSPAPHYLRAADPRVVRALEAKGLAVIVNSGWGTDGGIYEAALRLCSTCDKPLTEPPCTPQGHTDDSPYEAVVR